MRKKNFDKEFESLFEEEVASLKFKKEFHRKLMPMIFSNLNSSTKQGRMSSIQLLKESFLSLDELSFIYKRFKSKLDDMEKLELANMVALTVDREDRLIDKVHLLYTISQDMKDSYPKCKVIDYIAQLSQNLKEDRESDLSDVFFRIGNDYYFKEDYRRAELCFDLAILFNPLHKEAIFNRALTYYNLGEYETSIKEYSDALELDPLNKHIYNNRGDAYFKLKRYTEAIRDYTNAITIDKEFLKAYFNRGISYASIGKYEEAVKDFSKAIQINPNMAELYYFRGLAYHEMENLKLAEDDVKKVMSLDPNILESVKGITKIDFRLNKDQDPELINPKDIVEYPTFNLKDIVGQNGAKEEIKRLIIYPLKYTDLASRYNIKITNIMLYGPPGCGKTMMAKAIAGELRIPMYTVDLTIQNMYVGNSEKNIRLVFEEARKNSPSMIFLDEIDALCIQRDYHLSSHERKLLSQILIELSMLEHSSSPVLVVAATNYPWDVDIAVVRAGRIGKEIFLKEPDFEDRKIFFKELLSNKPVADSIDYDLIANETRDFSFSLIKQIVNEVMVDALCFSVEYGSQKIIDNNNILQFVRKYKPDVTNWKDKYKSYNRNRALKSIGF